MSVLCHELAEGKTTRQRGIKMETKSNSDVCFGDQLDSVSSCHYCGPEVSQDPRIPYAYCFWIAFLLTPVTPAISLWERRWHTEDVFGFRNVSFIEEGVTDRAVKCGPCVGANPGVCGKFAKMRDYMQSRREMWVLVLMQGRVSFRHSGSKWLLGMLSCSQSGFIENLHLSV